MPESMLVWRAMAFLAVAMGAVVVFGVWRATRRGTAAGLVATAIAALMAGQVAIANSGILREWDRRPPVLMLLVVTMVILVVLLARSSTGEALVRNTPLAALVASQAFRFPLELTMHRAFTDGLMPEQMSYSGCNFDILTGISAIIVASLVALGKAGRKTVIVWNLAGFLLLLNIVTVAIVSLPFIGMFGKQENVWVTYTPYVWLPGVLVPCALLGHILVWKKLRWR